jgi:hypothetical protein
MEDKKPLGTTWYKVGRWKNLPEPVTVVKSTTNRVWCLEESWQGGTVERMSSKESTYGVYFETEAAAVEYLRKRFESSIANLSTQLNDARSRLGELNKKYGSPNR